MKKNGLQHPVVGDDIRKIAILHAKTARNDAHLRKAQPGIEPQRCRIGADDSIKLQYAETHRFCLGHAMPHKGLAYVFAPHIPADSIAGIADVPAAAYIVWM